jgi:hypothetical protein
MRYCQRSVVIVEQFVMCNLYSTTTNQAAIAVVSTAMLRPRGPISSMAF